MLPLIVIAVVLAGFLAAMTVLGVLGGLAPRDWLLLVGTTLTAALLGVLLYWTALRAWVRAGNHPLSLRILACTAGAMAWLLAFEALFWKHIADAPVWEGETEPALLTAVVFAVILSVVLAIGLLRPRRFRDA
jgi:hypothetical protein